MSNDKFITQLSIFISNEPGSLAAMTRTLKECDVNIKAFNIAESSGFGVFRAIVDDPEGSYAKLKGKNLIVRTFLRLRPTIHSLPPKMLVI